MTHIGIVFDLDESWIGGSYYIKNLISALKLLPETIQPEITLLSTKPETYRFISGVNYGKLTWLTIEQFSRRPSWFPFDAIFPYPIFDQDERTVSWIPDFQEHHLPQFFSPAELASRQHHHRIRFATAGLIVSSEDVRKDVERFYPGECPNIEVVHFAAFNHFDAFAVSETKDRYGLPDKYIMCANQLWVHKNHFVVIKAVERLRDRGVLVNVVFTGSEADYRLPGYSDILKSIVRNRGMDDRITFLGFIPREDQLALMNAAEYIIQPSLFEGWSTVIEDAKSMGQFVVASDLDVHREQLPENGRFFSRHDAGELARIMLEYCTRSPSRVPINYNVAQLDFAHRFVEAIDKFSSNQLYTDSGTARYDELKQLSEGNILSIKAVRSDSISSWESAEKEDQRKISAGSPERLTRKEVEEALLYLDVKWYQKKHSLDGISTDEVIDHFITSGFQLNHEPNPLFDRSFYAQLHSDVASNYRSLFYHFLKFGDREHRSAHPLFDASFYVEKCREAQDAPAAPLLHFIRKGVFEGTTPHPLFDPSFYTERYPDVMASDIPAFLHFLNYGLRQGRDPHPLFDTEYYVARYPESAEDGQIPFINFLRIGLAENRQCHICFDPTLYYEMYPDVASAHVPALLHFARYGIKEQRKPHPWIDLRYYGSRNSDLSSSPIRVFAHLLERGLREHRQTHPLFDPHFYASRYGSELLGLDPLTHFLKLGMYKGCEPNAHFNSQYYRWRYDDVKASPLPPALHFALHGDINGRSPSPYFDASYYLSHNADVASSHFGAFEHYVRFGAAENRIATAAGKHVLVAGMSEPHEFLARSYGEQPLGERRLGKSAQLG